MAHHPGSPPARQDPRLNITDLYLFDAGPTTVLMMNLGGTPADDDATDLFRPEARHEFKVHLDDHDREDLTYRLTFSSTQYDQQPYSVERLTGPDAGSAEATGTVIARGRTGERISTQDGGQVWAGLAAEPFYLDLRQLQDVDRLVRYGAEVDLTHWVRGVAEDSFAGARIRSIVLTVPVGTDGLTTGRRVGTWAATRVATDAGGWSQIGRTALPLVCTIFGSADSEESSPHGQTHPADDPAAYGPEVAELVAATVERLGTSERPGAYADSVMERIVPDLLRYVVGSPAVFGFARFNGRRMTDNAAEVIFSLATNAAVPTGLRAADTRRSTETFPFVIPAEGG